MKLRFLALPGAMPTPSNVGMLGRKDFPPATRIVNHQSG